MQRLGFVLSIVLGVALLSGCTFLAEATPDAGMTIISLGPEQPVSVVLHVPSANFRDTVRIEWEAQQKGQTLWRVALRELMHSTFPENLASPLPRGTTLVTEPVLSGGVLFLNVSDDVMRSRDQDAVILKSLVLTLTEIPDVEAVQILVDGHRMERVVAEIDTRYPLTRDMFFLDEEIEEPISK
jgi:hypothetical protein